jgi:transcriptional regulator with GAF, ATPase, and Fis domain
MVSGKPISVTENIDLYVWEGNADIAARAERGLEGFDVNVVRADTGMSFPPARDPLRVAVALVSVSVMGDQRLSGVDWLAGQGIPVIWVAAEERGHDPRYYPPAYSYTLPLLFTGAELRALIGKLTGVTQPLERPGVPNAAPLVAVSDVMRAILAEADMFADTRSNAIIFGETGVGKERIARRLHEKARWSTGPFVAVNCGAVPEGLFEAHFFGHTKGAFTGAVGSHKGYFEQADGGTLFLDEIGDLPLYQQVKLLRVLEHSTITRLGSTTDIPVSFRLVTATNKDLRLLVAEGEFRADLYYRLAVIELTVPSLQARGPEEKIALFKVMIDRQSASESRSVAGGDLPLPDWLLARVAQAVYPGNVRELSNVAERVGLIRRQFGDWDRPRIERIFERMEEARETTGGVPLILAAALPQEPPNLSEADKRERDRVLVALNANGWRRQATANELGISRKVLWEKMRKFQLVAGQGEIPEGFYETS